MDRLEKALDKARERREETLHGSPLAPIPALNPAYSRKAQLSSAALSANRIVASTPHDPHADIFRILRTKLLQRLARNEQRSIAVTSPTHGVGKTTIAVNLALTLALDVKQTVCLVDLNLRDPKVSEYLGLNTDTCLTDYLLREKPVADCLVRVSERLVVLPVKSPLRESSETLSTPKMAALARELASRYPDRIIIYDMPPILTHDDTLAFMPNVDGVLLVVKEAQTQVDELNQCLYALREHTLLGTVLNQSVERSFNRK